MSSPFVPLVTGDPSKGAATFTRFVLPFSYSLCFDAPQPGAPGTVFQRTPDGDIPSGSERLRYLTPETATALFQRAQWFHLGPDAATTIEAEFRDGRVIAVNLAAPRLALFEAPDASKKCVRSAEAEDEAAILRTGFLMLDIHFPADAAVGLDHLLELNELFRYWQCPFPDHSQRKGYWRLLHKHAGQVAPTPGAQELYLDRWAKLLAHPIKRGEEDYARLFPSKWEGDAKTWIAGRGGNGGELLTGWIAMADPRAFVWTCAVTEDGGDVLRAGEERNTRPEELGPWVALVNVDSPASQRPSPFEIEWAKKRTYDRWAHDGTFYGFCSHAGAVLAPPLDEPPVWRQFATMHFDQTLLLLYLRVTTFRFSQKLSAISGQAVQAGRGHDERFLDEFRRLRWAFALFTNLYQFPLLSNQQQGIEMYEKARKHMDVDALFGEVQQEIEASEEYLDGAVQTQQTDAQVVLSVVATVGLALALGLTWLQVRPGGTAVRLNAGDWWVTVWLMLPLALSALLLWGFGRLSRWRRKR